MVREIPPEPDPVYCFQTIGQVDYYAVPDSMGETNQRAPAPPSRSAADGAS